MSTGLLTAVGVINLTSKHRPWDVWFIVMVGLLWIGPLITVVTALTRPALLRLPPQPLRSDSKMIAIAGVVLLLVSLLAPPFLLPEHAGAAILLAIAGCALSCTLFGWASRRTDRAESTVHS